MVPTGKPYMGVGRGVNSSYLQKTCTRTDSYGFLPVMGSGTWGFTRADPYVHPLAPSDLHCTLSHPLRPPLHLSKPLVHPMHPLAPSQTSAAPSPGPSYIPHTLFHPQTSTAPSCTPSCTSHAPSDLQCTLSYI